MIRIGIDATPLPPQPVGAGNYIIQLIRALATSKAEFEFVIYAQESGRELIAAPLSPNLEWVIVPDQSPGIRLIWEQAFLPKVVKKSGVQILHSLHYTRPMNLSCASVVTFHDMTFFLFPQLHTYFKRIFFPLAIRQSARKADALIAVSESTRQDSIRLLRISPNKIHTVRSGINEEYHLITEPSLLEACRQKYNLPEKFILFVGMVEPRKNLPLLLNVYAKLALQVDCPPLVVVGRFGWMVEDIFQQVRKLNLQNKIHFTGYIPGQDLPIVYNLAQIFVYPSIYEGFGFPPLEAMACGTPVITSAVSAMLEHVGDAGMLVPPQDEEALLQAMLSVLTDRVLHQQLSIKGQAQAKQFTWQRTAQETLNLYRQIATSL